MNDNFRNGNVLDTLWKNTKDLLSYASSSTKSSNICINTSLSEITVKNEIGGTGVNPAIEIDYGSIQFHTSIEKPTLCIREWIQINLVRPNIMSLSVLRSFKSIRSSLEYYNHYLFSQKLLHYGARVYRITVCEVQDNHLKDTAFLEKFVRLNDWRVLDVIRFERILKSLQHSPTEIDNLVRNIRLRKRQPITTHSEIQQHHVTQLLKCGVLEDTIRNYQYYYFTFLNWLKNTYLQFDLYPIEDLPLYLVTHDHLEEFKLYLNSLIRKEKYTEHSASNFYYEVVAMFKRLFEVKAITKDVTRSLSAISFDNYYYRDIPTNAELKSFFDVVLVYSPDPLKHQLAFSLMLFLGLRGCEVAELRWDQIDLNRQEIYVHSHGGQTDTLHIPTKLISMFESLQRDSTDNEFVFSKNHAKYKKILLDYYKLFSMITGWKYPGGLHLLRHTFITRLSLHPECTIMLLMQLARHRRPETTSKYIHRSTTYLKKAVNQINYFEEDTQNEYH